MEDGLIVLFFGDSVRAIALVGFQLVLKLVLLVTMVAVNTTRWD